jgi:hypothetical protein
MNRAERRAKNKKPESGDQPIWAQRNKVNKGPQAPARGRAAKGPPQRQSQERGKGA